MKMGMGGCWEKGVQGCCKVRVYGEGHGEYLWFNLWFRDSKVHEGGDCICFGH